MEQDSMWSVVVLLVLSWASLVRASPIGISYERRAESGSTLPILNLPYGSYRAATYRAASDV